MSAANYSTEEDSSDCDRGGGAPLFSPIKRPGKANSTIATSVQSGDSTTNTYETLQVTVNLSLTAPLPPLGGNLMSTEVRAIVFGLSHQLAAIAG